MLPILPFTVFKEQWLAKIFFEIIGKSYILTLKRINNWAFLISFLFTILFSFGARD